MCRALVTVELGGRMVKVWWRFGVFVMKDCLLTRKIESGGEGGLHKGIVLCTKGKVTRT